jgi:uncharacterized protein (TIGR02145 family)
MTGKLVAQHQSYLENTRQVFNISGLNSGFYLINVNSEVYRLTGMLLSESSSKSNISLKRISSEMSIDKQESENEAKGTQATVDMFYTTGDRLKFTGTSGIYSTVITDIPEQDKIITFNFMPCTDNDNNNYPVVEIGGQTWMATNLKTTKYNNGDLIGTTTPATLDISAETNPKYQWSYNGDENNVPVYGRLYTWHAITDSRGVCPTGWYIPSDGDWTLLVDFLGGEYYAGGKLKETGTTHWSAPNDGATNESGFTALPSGWRRWNGVFYDIGLRGLWSSSTSYNTLNAWFLNIDYDYEDAYLDYAGKRAGLAVRCLKISVPVVITTPVEIYGTATATVGGEVISHGGTTVTDRGVFYGPSQNPVTTGTKLQSGAGEGVFEINLTGLTPDKTYYVTAYATNSIGTSYGDEESFTTNPLTVPELSTTRATGITQTSAITGGNISYDGGADVTARGVCWGTSPGPTISGNYTSDGVGAGTFVSNLTGLTINTKYYVRAYATNSIGTNYGNEIFFSTKGATGTVSDVDGNTYQTIQIGTQIWMAENLKTTKYNDETSIPNVTDATEWLNLTTPGYCWYNNDAATYKTPYGAMYNWYAVNTGKLCPAGWHVPSEPEFYVLDDYLGSEGDSVGKIK